MFANCLQIKPLTRLQQAFQFPNQTLLKEKSTVNNMDINLYNLLASKIHFVIKM